MWAAADGRCSDGEGAFRILLVGTIMFIGMPRHDRRQISPGWRSPLAGDHPSSGRGGPENRGPRSQATTPTVRGNPQVIHTPAH